jgi:hypothetical protein
MIPFISIFHIPFSFRLIGRAAVRRLIETDKKFRRKTFLTNPISRAAMMKGDDVEINNPGNMNDERSEIQFSSPLPERFKNKKKCCSKLYNDPDSNEWSDSESIYL